MRSADQAEAFYNQFSQKLLADYVHGNQRAQAAIQYTLTWVPGRTQRIVDIGCGIGWSSWEIKRHFPGAQVTGLDLSPKLIEVAQSLFAVSGLEFLVQDVTNTPSLHEPTCDAVVMLDVYEHIPRRARAAFHAALNATLSQEGAVILSFPSVSHQLFLRENQPEGLQPVDEDVTRADIDKLAEDIGCQVVDWEPVSIWRPEDYVHAVLRRRSRNAARAIGLEPGSRTIGLESREERSDRVRSRLGFRVTHDGRLIADHPGPAVSIVFPSKDKYSETFIRAHVERLPAEVHVLYGGHFPTRANDEISLTPQYSRAQRVWFRLNQQLRGLPWDAEAKQTAAIKQFLRQHQIQAVLAEYGQTGVAMMEICREMGIPLVVHFHGYDAFNENVVDPYRDRYRRLFKTCAAVVAVSRDMVRQLVQLGAPDDKVHWNPCGVDVQQFGGADPASAPPIFLAVGRFVDKKAPHLTLLAFRTLLDACPEARLVMMGEGNLWEACKQLAAGLGIAESVSFPGVQPHAEVATAMRRARAFVQHSMKASYGDSEGTPVGILEAAASGLPVVSTRHAGIPDVVLDGETGLLVDEGDVDGMAAAMVRLARDPRLAGRMGQAGRTRVEERFSMEKSIARLWHIIERVTGY